jgi:putative ABC transport system substrate-binding protein
MLISVPTSWIFIEQFGGGYFEVKRREFITLIGGATAAWPFAVGAQSERLRRVGILLPYPESDTEAQMRVRAFKQELQRLGWIEGSKVQFDERWTTDNMDLVRANAASLLELKPDVIVSLGNRVIPILKQMTREVPIIIAGAVDPVGAGLVASLAHPGGNITGFSVLEVSVVGKMLALLKQIAPKVSRSALIYNPDIPSTVLYERSFKAAATSLAVEPIVAHIHGMADIERVIQTMVRPQNGGIVFPPDLTLIPLREQIVAAVARGRLPAIYSDTALSTSGGLAAYSADRIDLFRKAASYVDRILRGEKPGDLPIQEPTKYEFVINLKTAKGLGLEISPLVVALANKVIE